MILDKLTRIDQYRPLLPHLSAAMARLEEIKDAAPGRYEYEHGFILIQEGTTSPIEAGDFEAHRKFLDVQILLSGAETIAWFALKYPIIGTLGIPADTFVAMPASKNIISYAIEIGELKRGDTKLEVEACVWYNKDTGAFVCGEVSWRAELKDAEASYELFNAIQHKAPEILDAGMSKNACIK